MDTKYNLIVRNNNLIEAFIDMTKNEYKLTLYLISQIRPDDEDFTRQKITLKDMATLFDVNHNGLADDLKAFDKSLASNTIQLMFPDGHHDTIPWFSLVRYVPQEGTLIVKFNAELKPLLLNIRENYTKVFLDQIRKFDSKHTIRIYELLKQYESIGYRIIEIDDLRNMLGMQKTYKYGNIKKRALVIAQKEMEEHTDIYFTFEEIKRGRKVNSIKFNIFKNDKDGSSAPDENLITEENNNLSLKNEIENTVGGKLGSKGFKYLVDNVPANTIKLYLDNWSKFTPGINPIGFFVKACVEKYDIPKMINNKPVQTMNYEQREYDDEFFDSLYVNLDKYKD